MSQLVRTDPVTPPAGATPDTLSFTQMYRRAEVLAKTELVPKALQGNPEAIMVVGVWGAEHRVPLMTAIQDVHIIENRPSPSAQLRLALIRRAGHEVRWVETSPTRAVIRGRRHEYRNDPDGWTTVEYTLDDARKAELLDRWVERWMKPPGGKYDRKYTWKIGDDQGAADMGDAPDWVAEELKAGRVHSKDNWRKYPADMLRARAASVLARMEFSDVMAALGVDAYTPEEHGYDVGQDLDEPAEEPATAGGTIPSEEDGDAEEVHDAVVVEDLAPGSEPTPPTSSDQPPTPGEEPDGPRPPMPELREEERADIAALKNRIRQGMTQKGWVGLIPWLEACGIPATLDGVTRARIAAIHAELDLRGVATLTVPDDVPPPPPMPGRTDE